MSLKFRFTAAIALTGLVAWVAPAQDPAAAKGGAKGRGFGNLGMTPRDSRATCPKYHFEDTGEDLMYCVFASSKVSKDKAAPLIVSLHGLGAGPGVMMTKNAIDLAEAGGYVVVAPMGYNVGGWYGSPLLTGRGGAKGPAQPENLAELSEKDVMNVIGMIRKEYKIDSNRMYLMGHSMGGAGTVLGPVLGALLLTALPELLRDFKELYLLFYGVGILLLSIFLPNGLAGLARSRAQAA